MGVYIPQEGDVVDIPVYFGAATGEPIIIKARVPDYDVWDKWERTRQTARQGIGAGGAPAVVFHVDHESDTAFMLDILVGVENMDISDERDVIIPLDEAYREAHPDTWKKRVPAVLLRRAAAFFYQPTLRAPQSPESPKAQEKKS